MVGLAASRAYRSCPLPASLLTFAKGDYGVGLTQSQEPLNSRGFSTGHRRRSQKFWTGSIQNQHHGCCEMEAATCQGIWVAPPHNQQGNGGKSTGATKSRVCSSHILLTTRVSLQSLQQEPSRLVPFDRYPEQRTRSHQMVLESCSRDLWDSKLWCIRLIISVWSFLCSNRKYKN